jgi:hypothetical protein
MRAETHQDMRCLLVLLCALTVFGLCLSCRRAAQQPPIKLTPLEKLCRDWATFCRDSSYEEQVSADLSTFFPDTLKTLARRSINLANNKKCRDFSLKLLSILPTPEDLQILHDMLLQDSLCVGCARVLVQKGDWDLAAPVLERFGEYEALGGDSRALPILKRGCESLDPVRSWHAANGLTKNFRYSDDCLIAATLQVLALPNDSCYLSVKKEALSELFDNRRIDLRIITAGEAALKDTTEWLRSYVGFRLRPLARYNETALKYLRRLGQEGVNDKVRTEMADYIKWIQSDTFAPNRGRP